jgi:thioredoxin 2
VEIMSATNDALTVRCPGCGRLNRVRRAAPGAPHCGNCGRTLPWQVDADAGTFHEAVEESSVPVLVDFWAPWCGPCRMVEPVLERLARDHAGHLKIVRVDSDLAPELSQRFDVRGIPTLIVFDHGRLVDRMTGANTAALPRWVESHLASLQAERVS